MQTDGTYQKAYVKAACFALLPEEQRVCYNQKIHFY